MEAVEIGKIFSGLKGCYLQVWGEVTKKQRERADGVLYQLAWQIYDCERPLTEVLSFLAANKKYWEVPIWDISVKTHEDVRPYVKRYALCRITSTLKRSYEEIGGMDIALSGLLDPNSLEYKVPEDELKGQTLEKLRDLDRKLQKRLYFKA